jgi:hypothetical protein
MTHEREATLVGHVKQPERRVTEPDIWCISRERRGPVTSVEG